MSETQSFVRGVPIHEPIANELFELETHYRDDGDHAYYLQLESGRTFRIPYPKAFENILQAIFKEQGRASDITQSFPQDAALVQAARPVEAVVIAA